MKVVNSFVLSSFGWKGERSVDETTKLVNSGTLLGTQT